MTIAVNVPETAEPFAALLQHLHAGDEILLAQSGVAIARIVPISPPIQPRIPGQDKGKVTIASDFNDPLPDAILDDFCNPLSPTP